MQTSPSFRERITEYIRNEAKPVEKFGHQPRLYALTRLIGEAQTYDDDVVYAAAWLHDLGVFIGHRPEDLEQLQRWDNTAYAMEQAPEILQRFGFPAEKIPAAVEAIRTHQPSGQPTTLEGRILRDADILEQLGAIGILRTVCKVGRDTRFQTFTAAVDSLKKALTTLPGQLTLDRSRKLAEPKIKLLQAFLESVEEESYEALY
jgi:uncharacterized protein